MLNIGDPVMVRFPFSLRNFNTFLTDLSPESVLLKIYYRIWTVLLASLLFRDIINCFLLPCATVVHLIGFTILHMAQACGCEFSKGMIYVKIHFCITLAFNIAPRKKLEHSYWNILSHCFYIISGLSSPLEWEELRDKDYILSVVVTVSPLRASHK